MSLWPYVRPGPTGRELLLERYERTLDGPRLAAAFAEDAVPVDLDPASLVVRPVALKKDRFIVAVEGRSTAGARVAYVAKGYADERAERVQANHRALWEGGLGDVASLVRTNRPIAVLPSLGLTIGEWLPGDHPGPSDPEAAARTGRAAATLHGCHARVQPAFTLAAFLDNVDRHVRLLTARAPVLGAAAGIAAAHLGTEAPGIGFETGSPLNGDMSLGSFLVDGGRTYLIDWDISCRFDRAWDVGHYLTQLRRFGLERGEESGQARIAFLGAYEQAAGRAVGRDFDARVAFFEAAACLHKAYSVARVGREDWPEVGSALVASAQAIVTALASRPERPADQPW